MIKKNLPKRVGDFKVLWDINDAVSPILGVPLLTDLDVDTFPELPLLLCTLLLLADLPSEIKEMFHLNHGSFWSRQTFRVKIH